MMRKIEWSVADSIHTSAVAPPMIGTIMMVTHLSEQNKCLTSLMAS